MRKKNSKSTIINLIKDDLRHQHTVLGLNLLGFDHDNGMLDISRGVFSLMELNINDNRLQHLTDEYCDRAYHVTAIAFNDNESFERLATEIYNWLSLERKKYMKLLSKS
ncbi:hypothetical protein [Fluviicola taffensis]|uniref:hypothetical protein n=1 Tax=Fluviicola taffensis TaxID=191579 RepID=UPI003137906A